MHYHTKSGPKLRRGLTLLELLIVVLVVAAIVIVLMVPGGPSRHTTRQLKDSTQIRGIHQGMILWAGSNKDMYPLPSVLDAANWTVESDAPESKDTMSNVLSILVFNGFFSPELSVSPNETNPNIKIFDSYQYRNPSGAAGADKSKALWDPALNADFTNGKIGNVSYAMALPAGARRAMWAWGPSNSASTAILGNRGPQIKTLTKGKSPSVSAKLTNPQSNTLSIHGGRTTWEGNISYNDNHVDFETSTFADENQWYKDSAGISWFDCLFANEPDDPTDTNNYLSIYTTAGKETKDFNSIWD